MTSDPDIDSRMTALEQRLERIEKLLENGSGKTVDGLDFTFEEVEPEPVETAGFTATPSVEARKRGLRRPMTRRASFPVTEVLGWGGVTALVLAAAYLIKLGIDLGWLTPARQIMTAVICSVILIVSGVLLKRADRQYASLLPAGGIVILFLATYGAHLYYRLIPFSGALAAATLVCLLSLWLCQAFQSELYAFFAVAGSYSAPLLLDNLRTGVSELALYYTAWGLVFSLFAIWFGRRGIYLLAAYMALLGFDLVWSLQWNGIPQAPWLAAFVFQSLQGLIFAVATGIFTLHRGCPLDLRAAWAHLPPLLLFYLLEYALLSSYLPEWAPWAAIASALVVGALTLIVRSTIGQRLAGGELLLAVYVAVVLFHAGYLETVPASWQPVAGLLAGGLLLAWASSARGRIGADGVVIAALGLIFILNLVRVFADFDLEEVAGGRWLALVYAVELYTGYAVVRRVDFSSLVKAGLIYAGHLTAMTAAVHLFDHRLAISLAWCLLAVACLALAISLGDRLLGQSSLLVFAASAIKVLLFDLSGASPLIRVICLLVLGVSCYLGGWLYRKMGISREENPRPG